MRWLKDAEGEALACICAALTGDDPGSERTRAIADGAATAIEQAARSSEQADFRRAIGFLDNPLANALLARAPKRLAGMSQAERERLLQAWANSRLGLLRQGFQTFKRLTLFHEYALDSADGAGNPNWPQLGFPGPVDPPPVEKPLRPLRIAKDTTLRTDAVVVGSGAGGAVVAAELAAAGAEVIVLEKGG